MEEFFEFELANEEDAFIYTSGVNRGHVQIPVKITVCYFLTSSEKYLFSLLSTFAFGEKRTCFPSIEKLVGYSGWSRRTLRKHMDGLQKAQLTSYIKRPGTTNLYRIEELHKSTAIRHSETIHHIREKHFKRNESTFNSLKDKYLKSELALFINEGGEPELHYREVEEWFLNATGPFNKESDEKTISKGLSSIVESPKSKVDHLKNQVSKAKSLTAIKSDGTFNVTANPDKQVKPRKSKDYKLLDVTEWNSSHFLKYFEDAYTQFTGFELIVQRGDQYQLRALLDRHKNVALKVRIDLFFSSDDFRNTKRNIYAFSSSYTQSKLDLLLNSNQSNSYKNMKHKNNSAITNYSSEEQAQMDDWLKEIGGEG